MQGSAVILRTVAELRLQLDIRFSPAALRAGLLVLLLSALSTELSSESVTLTTYYPAPSGVYSRMITTGVTYLARDVGAGGGVAIGSNAAPAVALDVTGKMNLSERLRLDSAGCGRQFYNFTAGVGTLQACAAGTYATYTPGVFSQVQEGAYVAGGSSQGGFMWCCPR